MGLEVTAGVGLQVNEVVEEVTADDDIEVTADDVLKVEADVGLVVTDDECLEVTATILLG